jgi:sugar lactone lactonase YvrE
MPSNRRLWVDGALAEHGRPDGCAVDVDGFYWSARYMGGRVIRYSPAGEIDRIVEVPVPRVTMCAFGGPDLRTLYITTAREGANSDELHAYPLSGGLFAIDAAVSGLPEPLCAN